MKRDQLRICRVVSDFLPLKQAYGYFISFYNISKMQHDIGHKTLILKPAKSYRKEQISNFPIISIPLRKRGVFPSDRRQFLQAFKTVVESWDADIIHTHISVGNYLHRIQNLPPTVHHLHGLPYQALQIGRTLRKIGQGNVRLWDLRHDIHADNLYKRYLKRANAVVICCPSLRAIVTQRYRVPPNNVYVVFNGVSPIFLKSYSKSEIRKELALDEDRFIIIFVGRLIEGKGLILLLKALQDVKKKTKRKKIQLMIVGSKFGANWLRSLVSAIASRGDSVIEFSHVPYESMPKYYAAADLHFLGHTFGLGFPKTCLEALACGTPVIMIRNPDAEVITGQNERGMHLNNTTDHIELTKKILYVIENKEMAREMGERGRKLIHKKYTWAKTVENLNTIYSKVLEDF